MGRRWRLKMKNYAIATTLVMATAISGCSTSRMGGLSTEPEAPAPLPAAPSGRFTANLCLHQRSRPPIFHRHLQSQQLQR